MLIQATILVPVSEDLTYVESLAVCMFGRCDWTGAVFPGTTGPGRVKHACLTVEIDSFSDFRLVARLAEDIAVFLRLSEITIRALGASERISTDYMQDLGNE